MVRSSAGVYMYIVELQVSMRFFIDSCRWYIFHRTSSPENGVSIDSVD